jgi:serine protease DegS
MPSVHSPVVREPDGVDPERDEPAGDRPAGNDPHGDADHAHHAHHDDHDDHDDHESAASGAPPHPLDRVWLHPSELPLPPRPSRVRIVARLLAIPLVAAAAGSLVTVGVLALAGAFDREDRNIGQRLLPPGNDAQDGDPDTAAPAVVAVIVTAPSGLRYAAGVCVDSRGSVLTSAAIVKRGTAFTVVDARGVTHPGELIGLDEMTGLALVRVDDSLPVAPISSIVPSQGETVFTIGSKPDGSRWLGTGIVASRDAALALETGPSTSGLVETTADAAPEVAGGALVDDAGRVTGIVLAPVNGRSTTFAVPITMATRVRDAIERDGWVDHGTIGLSWSGVSDSRRGPRVDAVEGPAATAGLRANDIIVSVDGDVVLDEAGLFAALARSWPGDDVEIEFQRRRERELLTVKVVPLGEALANSARASDNGQTVS